MQIAIVLYRGFTGLDALGPYEVLRFMPETEVRFVSHEKENVLADSGVLSVGTTHTFEETPAPDIVLVPGSSAETATAMQDQVLLNWLNKVHKSTRLTLSVCSGAMVLAAAGLLKGHQATTHWITQKALSQFGAEPQKEKRVVKAGKIWTAAGVSAGLDLGFQVIEEICGRQKAEVVQLLIEYDPQPPIDSGHPSKASVEVFEQAKSEMLDRAKNPKEYLNVAK